MKMNSTWRHFSVVKSERQGFGSFHSEDIEILVRKDFASYQLPEIYESIQTASDNVINSVVRTGNFQVGKSSMTTLYSLDPSWTFINHGAFGATCVVGQRESDLWRQLCDTQPLRYYDRIMLPMVAHVVRTVADYFSCSPTQIMPLPNVTAGLNAVANSVSLQPGDQVLCLSISYGSTKKILKHACTKNEAELIIIPLPLPIHSVEELIKTISSYANSHTKLIVLDSITSNTALTLPVVDIAIACKSRVSKDCLIVVDGAHSMFSDDINLAPSCAADSTITSDTMNKTSGCSVSSKNLDNDTGRSTSRPALADIIDVYLTNGHKWLSAPKGCAFMWLSPRATKICPAIISHGFVAATLSNDHKGIVKELPEPNPDKLLSAFSWDGCRDYSALLSVPAVIRMWSVVDKVLADAVDHSRYGEQSVSDNVSAHYLDLSHS